MDDQGAIALFQEQIDRCEKWTQLARRDGVPSSWDGDSDVTQISRAITAAMPAVMAVAQVADQGIAAQIQVVGSRLDGRYAHVVTPLRALIGLLESRERLAAILRPIGPTISAVGLHRWIWEPAATHWGNGHRREALQGAGSRLDVETQNKVERWDVSGTDLATQSWSADPAQEGKPRLRPPGLVPGSESFKSALGGARALHQGVMLGIRNRATHDLTQPTEQEALEQLAAMSVVARWVEGADVER